MRPVVVGSVRATTGSELTVKFHVELHALMSPAASRVWARQ